MPRILCAEDNPETAQTVRFFLTTMREVEVTMCRDGAEALEALAVGAFDVVVPGACKPFNPRLLVEEMRRQLQATAGRRP